MDELTNQQDQQMYGAEEAYSTIRGCIITAQNKVTSAVNTAMVLAYHEIGEQVYKACGENDRAEYGKQLLQYLSERLTSEFGKGFSIRNLQMMRKFYVLFPNVNTLCSELSWSHYRLLMRISNQVERQFYMEECSKSAWSVRQLERQIHTMFYQRLLASQDKAPVSAEIQTTEPKPEYEKVIKDPYIVAVIERILRDEHYHMELFHQLLEDTEC